MKLTRRDFVKTSAVGVAGILAYKAALRSAYAFYQSSPLRKFGPGQVLRGVGPGGIPVCGADAGVAPVTGVTHYTVDIKQYADTLHPSLGPTALWGYNPRVALGGGVQLQKHLGGIFVVQKGTPIQITFQNNLPATHILPVDTSSNFPDAVRQNMTAVHLHGGLVPWISDGGPYDWFDPAGVTGPSFLNNQVLNPGASAGQAEYYYPNNQSARFVWYHDHAHDITRLNAYGGIASAYLIRDAYEVNLKNFGLPEFIENSVLGGTPVRELPIVIQDKIFVDANTIGVLDPTWNLSKNTGTLWYPHIYENNRWKIAGAGNLPMPAPSCIPEMYGDTMLANGTVYPEATVEARRYRLRVLNACQARVLNLQLLVDDGSADGITLNPKTLIPTNAKGPDFLVIGNEAGFLQTPAKVVSNIPFNPVTLGGSLITAPAERWDILVDFTGFAGKKVILYNDAPAPFPIGDPRNDYFPGAPKNPTITTPGFGPNTRQILRFNVVAATSADPPLQIPIDFSPGLDPFLVPPTTSPLPIPPGFIPRQLTLNETFDIYGRLIQLIGTNVPLVKGTFGRALLDPATEVVQKGTTEVWQIANLTGDTHPIHFHLVNVQILSRQPFKVTSYNGTPVYTGPARGPDPTELGWKETVKMHPGEVTTVIMRFDLPVVPFNVPPSTRPQLGNGVTGHEYVWHCHILEHEEHDMMRPLVVV